MRSLNNPQLAANEPSGHTAQYITIARALGNALGAMEDTIDQYSKTPGWTEDNGGIQLEAHCVTITLLAAALCESVANTVLATLLTPSRFGAIEGSRTVDKWKKWIPEITAHQNQIPENLGLKLELLFATRNAIMHPKATIFGPEECEHNSSEILHKGTSEKWSVLDPKSVREFAALCGKLAACLPEETNAKVLHISTGVQDYWLIKALERGSRRQSTTFVS